MSGFIKDVTSTIKNAQKYAINALPNAGEAVSLKDYITGGAKAVQSGAKKALTERVQNMASVRKAAMEAGMDPSDLRPSNTALAKSLLKNDSGEYSAGRIAGAAVGSGLLGYGAVNVPYRAISGGSLFGDDNGKRDIVGIPFI